jgi:hypothetical protein
LYKVLWPNLQHLSSAIGQCQGFFGTGLVCKAPLRTRETRRKDWALGHEMLDVILEHCAKGSGKGAVPIPVNLG